jgi:Family of unknown function (DUF6118)
MIVGPLLLAAVYAAGEIFLLWRLVWWSIANAKSTVLWLITFAFVGMFEITSIGLDAWNASQQLMLFASPAEWKAMETTNRTTQKSRDVIAKCRVGATKVRTAKKSTFWIEPENNNPE